TAVCASRGATTRTAMANGIARRSMGISLRRLQYSRNFTMRSRVSIGLLAALLGGSALVAAAPERVTLDALLVRSAWYLDYFIDQFENVVAEEQYVQDSAFFMAVSSPYLGGGRGGSLAVPPSASETARARHRDLRSDFLLVKS